MLPIAEGTDNPENYLARALLALIRVQEVDDPHAGGGGYGDSRIDSSVAYFSPCFSSSTIRTRSASESAFIFSITFARWFSIVRGLAPSI